MELPNTTSTSQYIAVNFIFFFILCWTRYVTTISIWTGHNIIPTDYTILMVMNIDNQLNAVGLRQVCNLFV